MEWLQILPVGVSCSINSFNELEGKYLDYLRTKMGHDRVYGVGPLSLIGVTESWDQSNPGSGLDNDVLQ